MDLSPEQIIAAQSAKANFQSALSLMKEGDYAEALVKLQQCLNAPYIPSAVYFQIGCCYLQQNHFSEAQSNFEKALDEDPHHLQALINLGACYMQNTINLCTGQKSENSKMGGAEAGPPMTRSVSGVLQRQAPFNLDASFLSGTEAEATEQPLVQAIHLFATACRLEETNALARFNLACALMKARRYIQARDQFVIYLKQNPNDLEAQYHLGFIHLMLEELVEAEKYFQNLLAVNSSHLLALHSMASIALKKNEPSSALGFYQRILAQEPGDEIATYMCAVLTQNKMPVKPPNAYIENLFDAYAERFEAHLQNTLQYKTPEHLYNLWKRYANKTQDLKILDLGCGTGLIGELFKRHAAEMIGVDLSSEMLKVAKTKNFYDQLIHQEILEFLLNQESEKKFDLIILADVLVYFGDLEKLFQVLTPLTNRLLFSIELTPDKNQSYRLTRQARYQHSVAYILRLAKENGFKENKHKPAILRMQNNQEVKGEVFYLVKS